MRWWRLALTAAGTLVMLAIIVARWAGAERAGPEPHYQFTDDALVAVQGDHELWRHRFGRRLEPLRRIGTGYAAGPLERIKRVDVNGDGIAEIVVAVAYAQADSPTSDELYCFDTDGQVRWTYRPDMTLHFQAGDFSAPWMITALEVVKAPRPGVYVAVAHHTWWPAAVMRIEASGAPDLRLVHSGHIYALRHWNRDGEPVLLAGGINNEYAAASVAVLKEDGPGVHSPQSAGSAYECSGCPAAVPPKYFAFGRSELSLASDAPYNRVAALDTTEGGVRIFVQEEIDIDGALIMYDVSPNLDTAAGQPADSYWVAHRRYEEKGRLSHMATDCRHRSVQVRTFVPGGAPLEREMEFTSPPPGAPR